jgi:hypothetical protein
MGVEEEGPGGGGARAVPVAIARAQRSVRDSRREAIASRNPLAVCNTSYRGGTLVICLLYGTSFSVLMYESDRRGHLHPRIGRFSHPVALEEEKTREQHAVPLRSSIGFTSSSRLARAEQPPL